MGAKNYSYEARKILTKEPTTRVTKIRGLTLYGKAKDQMDMERMLEFVEKIQQNEKVKESVPQVRIQINGLTKTLSPKEVMKMYSNYSNEKRYYNADVHWTKLWP